MQLTTHRSTEATMTPDATPTRSAAFTELEAGLEENTVDWALSRIGKLATRDEVAAIHKLERAHSRFKGGRAGVLDALEERKGELALEAKGAEVSGGTARGPRPARDPDQPTEPAAQDPAVAADVAAPIEAPDPADVDAARAEAKEKAEAVTAIAEGFAPVDAHGPTLADAAALLEDEADVEADEDEPARSPREAKVDELVLVATSEGLRAGKVLRVHNRAYIDVRVATGRARRPEVTVEYLAYDATGLVGWRFPAGADT